MKRIELTQLPRSLRFFLRRPAWRLLRLRRQVTADGQDLLGQPADRHLHLRAGLPRAGAPGRQARPRLPGGIQRAVALQDQPLRVAGLCKPELGGGHDAVQVPPRGSAEQPQEQHDLHLQGLRRLERFEDVSLAQQISMLDAWAFAAFQGFMFRALMISRIYNDLNQDDMCSI